MNQDFPSRAQSEQPSGGTISSQLASVVDELTRRVLSGEEIDAAKVSHEYPTLATELAQLLPAILAVADLSSSASLPAEFQFENSAATRTLGDFRILREIGRGGMGVVYEAEQLSLGRRVALKIFPFAAILDSKRLQRFKQEAQAAAMLRHPHIVGVYCVACDRGVYHYAMDLVDGSSLADLLSQLRADRSRTVDRPANPQDRSTGGHHLADTQPVAKLSTAFQEDRGAFFREIARLGVQVGRGIHYAHEHGVIHRDIKPSNLLIDQQGHAWITDFGLAQIQNEQTLTTVGDLLGTIRYMSPEQARGDHLLDARTDIYSLGATLYELMTLQPAMGADDRNSLLRQVEEQEPRRPRSIDPAIPQDLETVVLRAMAKQPVDRYPSAAELANDLQRFLDRKPILARRAGRVHRFWRWVQRRPHIAAMLAAIACGIVVLAVVGPLVAIRYARLASNEQVARLQAESDRRELQHLLSGSMSQTVDLLDAEVGASPLRLRLMSQIVDKYRRLAERSGDDPQLQFDMALAHGRLGRIQQHLGDNGSSEQQHRRAIRLLTSLVARDPENATYKDHLAKALGLLADVVELRDASESIQLLRDAVSILQEAVDREPEVWRWQISLNFQKYFLACTLYDTGQRLEGLPLIRTAVTEAERHARHFPDSHDEMAFAAFAKSGLANRLRHIGVIEEAEAQLRQAREIYDRHAAGVEDGWKTNLKIAHVECGVWLGATWNQLRRPADAESILQTSHLQMEEMCAGLPFYLWPRYVLADAYLELSSVLWQLDRQEEALRTLERCLANRDSTFNSYRELAQREAQSLYRKGFFLHWMGRNEECRECFTTLSKFEPGVLSESRPTTAQLQLAVTSPLDEFSNPTWAIGQLQQWMFAESGSDWQLLGLAQYREEDWQSARQSFEESIRLRNGGDAFDFFLLAMTSQRLGDVATAAKWYRKAIKNLDGPLSFDTFIDPRQLHELRQQAEELGCAEAD